MRDKILSRLKEKFPGVNLSKKRLDEISDKLSKKITEESEIDAKLDELNDILSFADIAKQDDRLRTLENKPKDKLNPSDNNDPQQTGNQQQTAEDDAPGWFKKHVEETNKKLAALEAKNAQGSMQSRREKDLKDIDQKFYARIPLPQKEEEYEAYIEGIKNDWKEFSDGLVEKGLMSSTKPVNGQPGSAATDKAIDEDIKEWAKSSALPTSITT